MNTERNHFTNYFVYMNTCILLEGKFFMLPLYAPKPPPPLPRAFDDYITPDVACQLLGFCYTDPGQQACHLYPLPSLGMDRVLHKVRQRLPQIYSKVRFAVMNKIMHYISISTASLLYMRSFSL